ncbi:MAG: hypothetical protein ACXWKG_01885 [Limisphaerales bacterium]
MNDQIPTPETSATADQPANPQSEIRIAQPTAPALRNPKSRRVRNGKIARLAVELRDTVSHLLYEGQTHEDIARELNEDGYPEITRQNITSWAKGGYQDWLKTHEFMAAVSLKADLHHSFPNYTHQDALQLNGVNNFLLAARMNQVIEHLDPKELARLIASDPDLFVRFIKEEFSRQQAERELQYKVEDRKLEVRRREQFEEDVTFAMLPESARPAALEAKKAELAILKERLEIDKQKLLADDHGPKLAA